jgi:hypothetical protein
MVGLDLTFFTACNACLLFKTIYIYISTICSDPKIHRTIGNLIIVKDKSFILETLSIFWAPCSGKKGHCKEWFWVSNHESLSFTHTHTCDYPLLISEFAMGYVPFISMVYHNKWYTMIYLLTRRVIFHNYQTYPDIIERDSFPSQHDSWWDWPGAVHLPGILQPCRCMITRVSPVKHGQYWIQENTLQTKHMFNIFVRLGLQNPLLKANKYNW